MRLFGRKPTDEETEERCPQCGERVPDGAADCLMCGVDLRPFRRASGSEELESDPTYIPAR